MWRIIKWKWRSNWGCLRVVLLLLALFVDLVRRLKYSVFICYCLFCVFRYFYFTQRYNSGGLFTRLFAGCVGVVRLAVHDWGIVLRRTWHINPEIWWWLCLHLWSLWTSACFFVLMGSKSNFCVWETFEGMFHLFSWFFVDFRPTTNAIMGLTFAKYVIQPFFPDCAMPEDGVTLVAAATICKFFFWIHKHFENYIVTG